LNTNYFDIVAGIGIGIALTSDLNDEDVDGSLVSAVLQGLACGTLIYVAFFEILERERSKSTSGLLQWTLLLLGFLCILGLQSIGK
jgi:solute carrier family 39 (zinc transporter), member 1/2/3